MPASPPLPIVRNISARRDMHVTSSKFPGFVRLDYNAPGRRAAAPEQQPVQTLTRRAFRRAARRAA